MIAQHSLEWIAKAGATGLADSVVVGSVLALLACVLILLFRQRSAAMRFGVLMTALLASVSLPFVRLSLAGTTSASESASLLHLADSWTPWILGAWAAIAGLAFARVSVGIWTLQRLRRRCRTLEAAALGARLADTLTEYCPSRKTQILISDDAAVPAAIGFLRPAVVLPAWLLEEMSTDELRHVIIHELSHLRRWDDWTNLLQQIVKALLFFHPAIWWMDSRLSLEREMACDDAVLMWTENPRGYAECLARIAERSFSRRRLAMAQAVVSRVRQTSRRVARILKIEESRSIRNGRLSFAVATVLAAAGMGVVWRTPLLLSFDTGMPKITTSVTVPESTVPLQPVKTAWHEPNFAPKPQVHRTILRKYAAPEGKPRLLRTSLATDGPAFTQSVMIVVVQDDDRVAVWYITTCRYSPSQQVRSAHKTT